MGSHAIGAVVLCALVVMVVSADERSTVKELTAKLEQSQAALKAEVVKNEKCKLARDDGSPLTPQRQGARRELMGGNTWAVLNEQKARRQAENEKYVASLSEDEQEKLRLVDQYCNVEPLRRVTLDGGRIEYGPCHPQGILMYGEKGCTEAKLELLKNGQYARGAAYARRAEIPPGHGATRSPSDTPPCKGDQGSCEWEYTWDNCQAKKKLECTIHDPGADRAEYCDAAASEDMDTVVVCCKADMRLTHWNGTLIESSNRKGAMKDCGVKGMQLRI